MSAHGMDGKDLVARRAAAERMRRQGVIGWILFHPATGLVLHLYRTLESARNAQPSLATVHHVPFDVLGVNGSGEVYRQIDGRLSERARDGDGLPLRIPLKGRRIYARNVPRHVRA